MRNFYILILSSISLLSCNAYKTASPLNSSQLTYSTYRSQQETFATPGGNIKYIDKGAGDVLLLLHGVPTSGWLYRNMIDELSKTHRVIVPDMLGFGNSDSPKGYDIYSEENHAKRILNLMNHLGINKWTQVIHDAGGIWTWELFKLNPTKIERLVILNAIVYEEGFTPPVRFKKGFIARTAMWSYKNGLSRNMMVKKLFKSGMKKNTLNKLDLEGYQKPLQEGKTRGMYYFFTQTCNKLPDYAQVLKNIDIPVQVIWGKEDSFLLWNPQEKEVMSHLKILNKNVHLLDAKHFIQEEKPDEIIALIQNFIQ